MSKKKSKTQERAKKNNGLAGLDKANHPRTRWEYMDADYIAKLSPKDKKYYNKFIEEFYGAALAPESAPAEWKKDLHKSEELRKDCRDRNNARNRDLYSKSRTHGWVASLDDNKESVDNARAAMPDLEERAIIKKIDSKNE